VKQFYRIFIVLAGPLGIGALVWTALHLLTFGGIVFPRVLTPSQAALTGLLLSLLWLLLTPGYKRLPFWLNLGLGVLFVSLALYPDELPLSLNDAVLLAGGTCLFLAARYIEAVPLLPFPGFARGLPLLLASAAAGLALLIPPSAESLAYGGELDSAARIFAGLNHAYRDIEGAEEQIAEYIDRKELEESLDPQEEARLIAELNGRIARMQQEMDRYRLLQRENETYRGEIEALKNRIGEIEYSREYADETAKVATIAEAVRSSSPRVRDFAVKIASSNPGSYYRYSNGSPVPGTAGIRQILAIHRYIASQWRYVNDPLFAPDDYYSPADRTIALGLAGDCDDFAVLAAASIEAIGGRTRILRGICTEGAHAWCEVYIGGAEAWRETLAILQERFPGRPISFISPREPNDYWLCLDWQVGIYSCGEDPLYLYQSGQ
jgi:Transglutaminase-like superfamily